MHDNIIIMIDGCGFSYMAGRPWLRSMCVASRSSVLRGYFQWTFSIGSMLTVRCPGSGRSARGRLFIH